MSEERERAIERHLRARELTYYMHSDMPVENRPYEEPIDEFRAYEIGTATEARLERARDGDGGDAGNSAGVTPVLHLKVFISGPIAGMPNRNREAFERLATAVRNRGWTPVIPPGLDNVEHEGACRGREVPRNPRDEDLLPHRYGCYMKPDLLALMECDAILMMPGWPLSKGARVEFEVADICGLRVLGFREGEVWNV